MVVPKDLLHIVLSKLPVKSLLRLRCVSKLWLNIIDSSYFINLHLTQTPKTTCSSTIIVPFNCKDYEKSRPMYAFEFDNKNKARKIDPPVAGYDIDYVYTCNGLISLSTEDSFVIWNPATHKHRVVEKVKVEDDNRGRCTYNGFGYDHKTDDYKVVMFGMQLKEEKKCLIVYIYSLKTGSWRKLGTTNHEIMGNLTKSVYANGAIHWIHSHFTEEPIFEMKRNMVALDLTSEKWVPRTMPPKQSENPEISKTWSLRNHHGSLYAGCCDDKTSILHLWVMNSNQETKINTWTKLFTIKGNGSSCIQITPLWSLKKTSRHQVLIHDLHELQLYDIEERTTEAFDVDVYDVSGGSGSGVSGIWKSFPCYETLVSI